MKFLLVVLISSTLCAKQNIPPKECLHAKYGHTLGGTIHSKTILNKKLLGKVRQTLPYSDKEASIMIEKKYPTLCIKNTTLILKNCQVFYWSHHGDKSYYFDADTLTLIGKED